MNRILITGGLNFIGSTLATTLCKNYKVFIVDKNIPKVDIVKSIGDRLKN